MIERVDIQTGHRTPGDQRMLEEIAPKARSSTGYETDYAASPRSPSLVITQASGTVERISLRFGKGAEDLAQSGFGEPEPAPDSRFVLVSNTDGNSTNGHWKDYYRVDTQTGLITPYTQGKFLKWSPDGTRFVTLTGRDLADYERKRDGTPRRVWVSPLYVGVTATGKLTSIVQGLVYVTGADWRPKR
jgi:hypothetical protein